MEYRQLGSSGVRVSTIGLGTNRYGSAALPQEQVTRIIAYAQDIGVNFIDSADLYQGGRSEITLGQALKGRWDRFVVATKSGMPAGDGTNDVGGSRYHMISACEGSLRRMQTDHIDLYYLHRWDPHTPIEETLRALDDLVRAGKIRYAGCSNLAAWQLAHANLLAQVRGWSKFVVIQSEYNMLQRRVELEVLPYCLAHAVGFVPFFPLAGGFLTGKYRRGQPAPPGSRGESSSNVQQYMTDAGYDRLEKLEAWAQAHGHGINELAEAWLLAQPGVCSVISGATHFEHVRANAQAAEWRLESEEAREVAEILAR
jgi:aryl-alcohol dehydrogenase-like predicted oxidoreductase